MSHIILQSQPTFTLFPYTTLFRSERGVLNIRHITDPGGRAREIAMLNRAIAATSADYLIFSNDHCVPRNDFVEIHMKRSRKQHLDRKSTRLNSSHVKISYAVFCLK